MSETLASHSGWTFDPAENAWTARVESGRWLVFRSEFDQAPTVTPAQMLAHFERDSRLVQRSA